MQRAEVVFFMRPVEEEDILFNVKHYPMPEVAVQRAWKV